MTEHRPTQRDIQAELKGLRLSGMAMAWAGLIWWSKAAMPSCMHLAG
jgi:hypothetical protein